MFANPVSTRQWGRFVAKHVDFEIWGPEDIQAYSVEPDGMKATTNREVQSAKYGAYSSHELCQTCFGTPVTCTGHFTHIELHRPVFNPMFLSFIKDCLQVFCPDCGHARMDPVDIILARTESTTISEHIHDIARRCRGKNKTCFHCGHEAFIMEGNMSRPMDDDSHVRLVRSVREGTASEFIEARDALEIFNNIVDEDCKYFGLSDRKHIVSTILTRLPVIPNTSRPSITRDAGRMVFDNLTDMYAAISQYNTELLGSSESDAQPSKVYAELVTLVFRLFDNRKVLGTQRSFGARAKINGENIKSIVERIVGKTGHIRGHLMGKRVNFSARSVITGDPLLAIDQVGVPRQIAMKLTFPERVTLSNKKRLTEMVHNGPSRYPGANYIVQGGQVRGIDYEHRLVVSIGDIVERHLIDDDVVIFNRQPTLHKMSMMGHRVKVLPFKTFRLNLAVTTPYNADFDGDEMNLHVPQSLEAASEVRSLMMVPQLVVSPQSNKPVISLKQDALLTGRLITSRDTFLTRKEICNVFMWLDNFNGVLPAPAILYPEPLWTGKQVVSACIISAQASDKRAIYTRAEANSIDLESFSSDHPADEPHEVISPSDTKVLIRNSELLMGQMDNTTFGSRDGSLVHIIWLENGPEATNKFLTQIQRVFNEWLFHYGFSIGIGDMIPSKDLLMEIQNVIKSAQEEVDIIDETLRSGKLEPEPGQTLEAKYEKDVNDALNKAVKKSGAAVYGALRTDNAFRTMVVAGSKGSDTNLAQVLASVGQQNVEGRRIRFSYTEFRTLPHYLSSDTDLMSRGFCPNSYVKGLTPTEFFFHAAGGREGVVDTAVKTQDSGYLERKLVKAVEDLFVGYDGTVRNSLNWILEFAYGEDGFDATFLTKQKFETLNLSDHDLRDRYYVDYTDHSFGEDILHTNIATEITTDVELQAKLDDEYETIVAMTRLLRRSLFPTGFKASMGGGRLQLPDKFPVPCNLRRLLEKARAQSKQSQHLADDIDSRVSLSPHVVLSKVSLLLHQLEIMVHPLVRHSVGRRRLDLENCSLLFRIYVQTMLAVKPILLVHKLTEQALDQLCRTILYRFRQAVVAAGEPVGVIAATSIAQPATQMTLNTFHHAGISAKNVTLGIPRLEELVHASKSPSCPSCIVYLKPPPEGISSLEWAFRIRSELQAVSFGDLVEEYAVCVDDDNHSIFKEDQDFIDNHMAVDVAEDQLTQPYVIRFVLSQEELLNSDISIGDIVPQIEELFENRVKVISSANTASPVIRIRPYMQAGEEESKHTSIVTQLREDFVDELMKPSFLLRGVRGISRVFLNRDVSLWRFDENMGRFTEKIEQVLETENEPTFVAKVGTGNTAHILQQLFQLTEYVDFTRTNSNFPLEIVQVLGIEAARSILVRELHEVISFDGSYVNRRHLQMISDWMTHSGSLTSFKFDGINKLPTGPLMRATFEQMTKVFSTGAVDRAHDTLQGPSQRIIFGRHGHFGTGMLSTYLDIDEAMTRDPIEFEGQSLKDARDASEVLLTTASVDEMGSALGEFDDSLGLFSPDAAIGLGTAQITPGTGLSPGIGFSPGVSPAYDQSAGQMDSPGSFSAMYSGFASPLDDNFDDDATTTIGAYSPAGGFTTAAGATSPLATIGDFGSLGDFSPTAATMGLDSISAPGGLSPSSPFDVGNSPLPVASESDFAALANPSSSLTYTPSPGLLTAGITASPAFMSPGYAEGAQEMATMHAVEEMGKIDVTLDPFAND